MKQLKLKVLHIGMVPIGYVCIYIYTRCCTVTWDSAPAVAQSQYFHGWHTLPTRIALH